MFSWERAVSGFLDAIGLQSIKTKIIAFALLATLIPSLTMGWLSYRNNRRAIDEKIVQQLTSRTTQGSRDLDLWLRDCGHELKVLSSSYEVSENIERLNQPGRTDGGKAAALRRLEDYLRSVSARFPNYEELVVVSSEGTVLASSKVEPSAASLAGAWLDRVRTDRGNIAGASWDGSSGAAVLFLAEPIHSADGAFLGAMAARVNLEEVKAILARHARDSADEVYLVTRKGGILSSSRALEGASPALKLRTATADNLFTRELAPLQFTNHRGTEVLGTLSSIPGMEWGVVAETDRAEAYAAIERLRNITLALISSLVIVIGLAAYLLGLTIVRPLARLTQGASEVSGGDLDVHLPVHGPSEVGYMTAVFNDMVARLRKFRDENIAINHELRERNEELRTLSITDSLTGLFNRTQLSELLARELARSQRHRHSFSILMIDIDHFKRFNDLHGHQAGDDILRRVAGLLREYLRACDIAARYGGEEFLILLTETGPEGAFCFAEKLREAVTAIRAQGEEPLTVSIGAASFPEHGNDVESVIRHADAALYESKRSGRNQVALARTGGQDAGRSGVSLR